MTTRWFLVPAVLCAALIAPAGCSTSHEELDCNAPGAHGEVFASSPVPVTQLVISGAACPAQPFCVRQLDGGQCNLFKIALDAAGICHIVATAADGQQATFDQTVTLSATDGTCGNVYLGYPGQIILFPPPDRILLPPDSTGWVDRAATGPTQIQGRWYGFADGFGADGMSASGTCESIGHQPPENCSQLTTPSPGSFPNTGGRMCTVGVAAGINLIGGTTPDKNPITGAGIAFSFNLPDMTAPALPYDAIANGVKGIAFDIDNVPASGLRVQFPTADALNPAFWLGNGVISPVFPGHNVILWPDVLGPYYDVQAPAFDPTMLLRVEFLAPAIAQAAAPFSFCVSNLAALPQ
jgi:hypothetical protein